MALIGTKAAARILGVTVGRLHQAAWLEKFPPPAKVNGGYIWTLEDLNRAHKVLKGRSLNLAALPPDMRDLVNRNTIVA